MSSLENFIDFDMGNVYLGRDHEAFLKRFVEIDLQNYISKMNSLMLNSEYEELQRSADTFSSTCCYVGAKHCQELSKKIAQFSKERKYKLIPSEMTKLIEHSSILEQLAKTHFDEKKISVTSGNLDKITSSTLEDNSDYKSFRLKPPQKRTYIRTESIYEDEYDPFEDINKNWKCEIY